DMPLRALQVEARVSEHCVALLVFTINSLEIFFVEPHMALEERTESNSRSLHWAPLRSWNLFSGRVRSRIPHESTSAQLPRSQSVRNYTEGARVGLATSRGSGHPRSSESSRKGGDISCRDHKQRLREGSHRQGRTSVADEQGALRSSESTSRWRASLDRSLEASDDWSLDRAPRPSAQIAHHQQYHHHDHHHHHYHYHHLYHQTLRRLNENQDQVLRRPSASGTASSSRSYRRNTVGRLSSHNQRRMPITTNSNVASNSRNVAIEARDRLEERLRGAAILSHRHNNTALPGGFMDNFSVLFDDEEDEWSDDEMWELGIQDWLAAWGYGDGWQSDLLSSAEQFRVITGLSKSAIRNLPKQIFVPQVRRRDKEIGDTSMEQDDCSVCLERFLAGQLLIHLPCKHRFHPDCLTPWLESHGQCPYCRARIGSDVMGKASSRPGASASVSASDDDLLAWIGLTSRGFWLDFPLLKGAHSFMTTAYSFGLSVTDFALLKIAYSFVRMVPLHIVLNLKVQIMVEDENQIHVLSGSCSSETQRL
ncbi:hypothetical protein GOP47_0020921, partial [Adiantum capillus-veneris]